MLRFITVFAQLGLQRQQGDEVLVLSAILYSGVLVWISAAAQHLNTVYSRGPKFALGDRAQPLTDDGFTGRSARALRNNMESALMFVPLALVHLMSQQSEYWISLLALVYMGARTLFTAAYWFKINALRSFSWLIGMIAIGATAILVAGDLPLLASVMG